MRLPVSPMRLLVSASVALIVSACGTLGSTSQAFPSADDLKVRPKPVPTIEMLASEQGHLQHDAAIEAWGTDGWLQVGRICRWAVNNGARLTFKCPKPPPDG